MLHLLNAKKRMSSGLYGPMCESRDSHRVAGSRSRAVNHQIQISLLVISIAEANLLEITAEMSKRAFQKGLACYQTGDFQTALEEFNQVREAGVYVAALIFFFLGYRTRRR
jgi:hypothetical protein